MARHRYERCGSTHRGGFQHLSKYIHQYRQPRHLDPDKRVPNPLQIVAGGGPITCCPYRLGNAVDNDFKCALPKDEATVNTVCFLDAHCGSSGRGRCGLMAQALREGNPGMMACTPLP